MSTPISWIEGQARGKVIGMRRKIKHEGLRPGWREFTKARQRINYYWRMMKSAMRAQRHIADCHAEIERLGGVAPQWPES